MPDDRAKRSQSQSERDLTGLAARRDRDRSQAARAIPEPCDEEITGRYEGPDLARERARRPTPERLAKLEAKQDEDRAALGKLSQDVARMDGKLDVLLALAESSQETKRVGMTTRAKVLVAIVGAVSAIAVAIAGLL